MTDRGRKLRLRVIVGLGFLSIFSIPPLVDVAGWYVVIGLGVGLLLLGLAHVSEFCRSLAEVVGAIAVPWLCLLGFNYLWHEIVGHDLSLVAGLVVAGLVFAAAAAAYLIAWGEHKWAVPFVALALAGANVIGIPLLIAAPDDESSVAAAQPLVSQLDIVLVVPPGRATGHASTAVADSDTPPEFDTQYSVARPAGSGVEWLLLGSSDREAVRSAALGAGPALAGAPELRPGADHVVVLVPGATDDPTRWMRIAARIAPDASVAVLLRTPDGPSRARWARQVERRHGTVVSMQELGTSSIADAAFTIAVQAPTSSEELALALRFRPVLLFDRRAVLDTPLDIDAFLASGRVELCHDDHLSGSNCAPVLRSSDLVNGRTHLRIKRPKQGAAAPASAIYVHPSEVKVGKRRLVLLDYWWYLDDNPANVGKGTSCGAGLTLPGKTCFDHQSDWEGMTVIVDRNGGNAVPIAVQYAQHSAVVRYGFRELQQYWRDRQAERGPWQDPGLLRNLPPKEELEHRPFAFVARGTHATYRGICTAECGQVAAGLKENSHDGLRPWPANDTAECIATRCVRLVPTRHGGRDAALWNSYDGVWGDRSCILRGAFCTAELSPGSPATQQRYRNPLKVNGYVDTQRKFHACGTERRPCPPLPQP